ncbi:hypothetical protein WMF37_44045 [Sorangium sp. So ce291]|uniref:hypothetical protein n=1 Tax=Sorangium sp. So ce291 TaxID=3133294 RepID=UPI003F5DD304
MLRIALTEYAAPASPAAASPASSTHRASSTLASSASAAIDDTPANTTCSSLPIPRAFTCTSSTRTFASPPPPPRTTSGISPTPAVSTVFLCSPAQPHPLAQSSPP